MGKRELLIVAAFVVFGAVAWRLTAPPAPEGSRPFSVDTFAEIWRNRNTSRDAVRAAVTTRGTIPVAATLAELRLSSLFAVVVEGGDRTDIAWTLVAEAPGADNEAARQIAERIRLQHDDLGPVIALSVRSPQDTPHTSTLTLHVPSRLIVRVESARRTRISSVAGVRLENLVGDTALTTIDGSIEGAHRNGELSVDDARDMTLALAGSNAVVRRPRGTVSINARNGSTRIEQPAGPVVVEIANQHFTIIEPAGDVRAGGIGGEITIERPQRAIDVDARRTRLFITLDRAVPATVFSAEGSVTLTLQEGVRVSLDIGADSQAIDASGVGLAAVERDGRSHLTHTVDNTARVAIRGERSSVVIARGK